MVRTYPHVSLGSSPEYNIYEFLLKYIVYHIKLGCGESENKEKEARIGILKWFVWKTHNRAYFGSYSAEWRLLHKLSYILKNKNEHHNLFDHILKSNLSI